MRDGRSSGTAADRFPQPAASRAYPHDNYMGRAPQYVAHALPDPIWPVHGNERGTPARKISGGVQCEKDEESPVCAEFR
jgi:hypothetical protein